MTEEQITFRSNGLTLTGIVRKPLNQLASERRPAFLVLHGFGSNKGAENVLGPCAALEQLGYVTMRFDMQGCGDSEGPRGHLLCLDQVQNTRDAASFLLDNPALVQGNVAVIGSSFGAAT